MRRLSLQSLLRNAWLPSFLVVIIPPAICFQRSKTEMPVSEIRITVNAILYKAGKSNGYPEMIAVKTNKGVVVFDTHTPAEEAKKIKSIIEKDLGKVAVVIDAHSWCGQVNGNVMFKDVQCAAHDNSINELYYFIGQSNKTGFDKKIEASVKNPDHPKDLEEAIFFKMFAAKSG